MPTLRSHTHLQATQSQAQTKACKRVCLPNRTADRPTGDREEQRRHNSRLASCGVTCLHSSSVFQLGFCAGLTVLFSEIPHERQAAKRWLQG